MTASDSSNDPDPDRTTRDPEIQKVIDAYLHGKPTNPDGSVKAGGS